MSKISTERQQVASTTTRINQLAVGGVIAGVIWIIVGLVSILTQITGSPLDIALIIGNLLLIFPLFGLYLLYRDRYPRLGIASFVVFLLGTLANVVGTGAFALGVESLSFLAFPVGILGELIGFLGFAWITARARRLPRWTGALLVLTFPGAAAVGALTGTTSEFGDYPGAVTVGLIFLIVGYLMYRHTA